ncbi:DUF4260 domain-containing protein [Flaviaesturariibacter amylovorans]|uniref:DUF4260 family protein n=1 Tax=Flaviaesturariibacter amylovorans TaxID=1084520 RepID=A0ABP8HF94_9BACT
MKTLIALEEAALTGAALYFLGQQPLSLPPWAWALLFFAPDASMLGYAAGPRAGAVAYNMAHHRGGALGVVAAGYFGGYEVLLVAGLLLFAHASFDRVFGYGLKYATGFAHRHLGFVGKQKSSGSAYREA